MNLNLTIDWGDDCTTVRIDEPRLDAAISLSFKDRMREVVAKASGMLVVDMTPVAFMDSSGLGALIALHKTLPDGHRLQLVGLGPNVARVFRLTRMDSVFTIHEAAPGDMTAACPAAAAGTQSAPAGPAAAPAPETASPETAPQLAPRAAGGGAG